MNAREHNMGMLPTGESAIIIAEDSLLRLEDGTLVMGTEAFNALVVPPAGIEPALPGEPDFKSGASANSAKGAKPEVKTTGHVPKHIYDVLSEIKLPFGWELETRAFDRRDHGKHYQTAGEYQVRITCGKTIDNMTGEAMAGWNGRWWRLSKHMTPGEIVQTVFKATMAALLRLKSLAGYYHTLAGHLLTTGDINGNPDPLFLTLEHEAREMFLYKGVPVLDPHYDIDKFVEFRKDPSSILGRS